LARCLACIMGNPKAALNWREQALALIERRCLQLRFHVSEPVMERWLGATNTRPSYGRK
jgi:hypothetical protein